MTRTSIAYLNASDRLDARGQTAMADTLARIAHAVATDVEPYEMLDELDVTDCPQCGTLVASDVHTACPECGDSPSYAAALNGTAY
jgi:hypothetical protein